MDFQMNNPFPPVTSRLTEFPLGPPVQMQVKAAACYQLTWVAANLGETPSRLAQFQRFTAHQYALARKAAGVVE
jgi:hypothetical protein